MKHPHLRLALAKASPSGLTLAYGDNLHVRELFLNTPEGPGGPPTAYVALLLLGDAIYEEAMARDQVKQKEMRA